MEAKFVIYETRAPPNMAVEENRRGSIVLDTAKAVFRKFHQTEVNYEQTEEVIVQKVIKIDIQC